MVAEVKLFQAQEDRGNDPDGADAVTFSVWDFGGQRVFYALHHAFLTRHGVYLVVQRGYEHVMRKRMGRKGFKAFCERPVVRVLAIALTYNVTSTAYLFFVLDVQTVLRLVSKVVTG